MINKILNFVLFVSFSVALHAKEITLVVPYSPGGVTDRLARILQPELEKELNLKVLVKNLPGVGNISAINYVLSKQENQVIITLDDFVTFNSSKSIIDSFQPINIIGVVPLVLFGNTSTNPDVFKTEAKFIIDIANTGLNGAGFSWINQLQPLQVNHVTYKGGSQIIIDVQSGAVRYGVSSLTLVHALISQNRLTPILVSTNNRVSLLPSVPTFREMGLTGNAGETWFGALVHKSFDSELGKKVSQAINNITATSKNMQKFESTGMNLINLNLSDSSVYFQKEVEKLRKQKKAE
jgi:tripartite-type tricarboxylate transporter receptor subunit TctC